jgi:hypothetical protein
MANQFSGWANILGGKAAVVTGAAAVAMAQSGAQIIGVEICDTVDPRSGE